LTFNQLNPSGPAYWILIPITAVQLRGLVPFLARYPTLFFSKC